MTLMEDTKKQIPTKALITDALEGSMSYQEYKHYVGKLVSEKMTSGVTQSAEMVHYTLLNHQRMRRWDKKTTLGESEALQLKKLDKVGIWLVLTESWCGDAAPVLPILHAIAQATPMLDLRIALRDENLELMDRFLTDNARSIPKLLVLDPDNQMEVQATWGPRPEVARNMVLDYKEKHGKLDAEFRESLQRWYNKDKGKGITTEVMALLALK
ncbi:thioredoxin family protein [Robiginitalea sp.]|uniref:thioredoxin family protein n=1 Tax=Robiginitalea sp. TaxID=1902411 RepID=UPI003C34E749